MSSCPGCGELREHMEAATWFDVDGKACVILSCRWCGSTYFRETLDGLSGKSPRAGSTNNMKTQTEKQPTKSPETPAARGLVQRLVRILFLRRAQRVEWDDLSLQINEMRSQRDIASRIGEYGLVGHYSKMMTEASLKRDLIIFPNDQLSHGNPLAPASCSAPVQPPRK